MVDPIEYANFLSEHYLGYFIKQGGSASKFVVASSPERLTEFRKEFQQRVVGTKARFIAVDSGIQRVHAIEHLFFAVSQEIDWIELARSVAINTLTNIGYAPQPDDPYPSLYTVARSRAYDANELRRDYNQALHGIIFRDYEMAHEFRIAMARLCQAVVESNAVAATTMQSVTQWLRGELRLISELRQALIFQKIGRHNARAMLLSTARWLRKLDQGPLIIWIDLGSLFTKAVPGKRANYTRSMVLDTYEVLRQIVDSSDDLLSTLIVVGAPPDFVHDSTRGIGAYQALKLRIANEVRDRSRANPHAALLELG
jgi:hypothetical protein